MHRTRQMGGERKEKKLPDAELRGLQGGDLSPPDAKTYLKDLATELSAISSPLAKCLPSAKTTHGA